ncbi:hypothetical protein [Demequina sp. NBRC 110057]|uniref:hypothetical protein n=1 Tax=Demequina sp. NBRC 110057 TaxID=1570346 RepID=UPI001177FAAE|nr:hypothetical protein [Demequina sp. NBRC 110057]
MNRLPYALSALALGAITLAGCSSGASTETDTSSAAAEAESVASAAAVDTCVPEDTTITATYGAQAEGAMQVAVAALEEKYPGLTIEATASASQGYDDITKSIVGDIAVGKRPDLIMSGLGQVGFWVEQYGAAPIDADALADTYQTQFLSAGTIDGETYLAPAQISAPVLLVNQSALDAAGAGEAEDIVTYDDLIAAAQMVTDATGAPSVSIPSVGLADWYAQAFVQGAGGTFVAEDGTAAFGDEAGIAGLSIWPDLQAAGLETGVLNLQDAIAPFVGGQTAFLVYTTSGIANLQGLVGDTFEWTAVDLPTADGVGGSMPAGGNGWIVLSDDSCRAAYANELVGELLSEDAVLAASGTDFSYIPVDSAAAETLLAGDDVAPQVAYAWSYDKELTPWGGFDGTKTAEVNTALTTMGQELQMGQDAATSVATAVESIDALVGGE